MFEIDDRYLAQVGLGSLSSEAKREYCAAMREHLERVVGVRMEAEMTATHRAEFDAMCRLKQPREVVAAWLHINYPQRERIVREEEARMRAELESAADRLLELEAKAAGGEEGAD